MEIAKHYPGRFECKFVAGMNRSSSTTGCLTSTMSINQSYYSTGGNSPTVQTTLGNPQIDGKTLDYLVIMFCPTLSAMYSKGGGGSLGDGAKLSGLYLF